MLTYKELKKEPCRFLALTSLTVAAFDELLPLFKTTWEADVERRARAKPRQRKLGGGRKPTLSSPEDRLLFILVYFKIFPVQEVQGTLFGMSQSQASVWINRLTPVLQTILKREVQLPEREPANLEQLLADYDLPEFTIDSQISGAKGVLRKEKPKVTTINRRCHRNA
jgi:hypothetical protein